jgi:transposase-like protein
MAETKKSNRRTSQGDASAARDLVVSGLPTCTIYAAEDGTWHMMAQLASDEEAALATSAPSRHDLCRQAQHALGLAGIGSRIDRERSAIGVYTDLSGAQFGLVRRESLRLLTLSGPGGIGKTRLALQAAADLLDDFRDGVFFVPLAPIRDHTLVSAAITQALGVTEAAGCSLDESIKIHLRSRHTLLVLDNFEQVATAGPLIADLLAAAPQLKVMVSSREVLHLYGEHEYRVPALSLPDIQRLPPMRPEQVVCPNSECGANGRVGVHSHKERRYICHGCKRTFADTTGTLLYRLKQPLDLVLLVLTLLAYGCPIGALVAAFGLDERTIAEWQRKAGQHAKQVQEQLVCQGKVDLGQVQADELYTKTQAGPVWIATAMTVFSRLWLWGAISASSR